MLLKAVNVRLVVLLLSGLLLSGTNVAGVVQCESIQSGDWHSSSTWSGCSGGFPDGASDDVVIKTGHEIGLDRTVTVHGLRMEPNSTLNAEENNGTYLITAEGSDINTALGKINSGSSLQLIAENGHVVLGAVDATLLNRRLTLQASQDITITDSSDGVNVFYFVAESTNPTGKIIVEEDINTVFRQQYNSQLELSRSVVLRGRQILISAGLVLADYDLELDANSNSLVDGSQISGVVAASTTNLTKSGAGFLFIETPMPLGISTHVNSGTLIINDTHQGEVAVSADARIIGNGVVSSTLFMNDTSSLSPGYQTNGFSLGTFRAHELLMSQDAELDFLVRGTSSGVSYDALLVDDSVQVSGNLQVVVDYPYDYADVITLIDNQGINPIAGAFDGINEGDLIAQDFQISYQGGDGNDLTLTAVCGELITVTTAADSGPGSFRAAMDNVCSGGTIEFADAYDIILDSTVQHNEGTVVVAGSGQTFQSSGNFSVLNVADGAFMRFNNVTIRNTTSDQGAISNYGILTMDGGYFYNNTNNSATGGGALSNYGSMTIEKVSFYQNNASQGGAVHNNGGFFLVGSTLYQNGNNLTVQGAAIYNNKQLELLNVTVVDNGNGSIVAGNSIYSDTSVTVFRMHNTVITNQGQSLSECIGPLEITFGYLSNFISDGSCMSEFTGDPLLGTWGNYGAYAPTIPILPDSPLINGGEGNFCFFHSVNTSDQLGNPRTIGIVCDIGAIEFIDVTAPQVTALEYANQTIDTCEKVAGEFQEIIIGFSEPVLDADQPNNFTVMMAGMDQSFGTIDDVVIDVLGAVYSDQNQTVTSRLLLSEPLEEGLVRVIVDANIEDEFFIDLNDGNDYVHQFRVENNNLFQGGQFDFCTGVDVFSNWQIGTNMPSPGADIDASNASVSLRVAVDDGDPLLINQCVDIESVLSLSMQASMKTASGGPDVPQSFDLNMYCTEYADSDCMGNVLSELTVLTEGQVITNTWSETHAELGDINPQTRSVNCGLEVHANQSVLNNLSLDSYVLRGVGDVIFLNGFD